MSPRGRCDAESRLPQTCVLGVLIRTCDHLTGSLLVNMVVSRLDTNVMGSFGIGKLMGNRMRASKSR